MSALKERNESGGAYEKAVVVSQWTSMLEIVAVHLKTMGMRITEINGEMIDA